MTHFQIVLEGLPPPNPDGVAELLMRVDDAVLTNVIRPGRAVDENLRIPAGPLAFWVAENWWRLRWEPKSAPPSDAWRMSHEMSAIGHGHAWPKVTIWGDRDRVMLVSKGDPPGIVGPVRFTTNAVTFVPAEEFEATLDNMLDDVSSIITGADRTELIEFLAVLRQERSEPESAQWRRIEAVSGYNPDDAPEELINELIELESIFKDNDVEEAVAASPGPNAALTLKQTVDAAAHGLRVNFEQVEKLAKYSWVQSDSLQPWMAAERAAGTVREGLGVLRKPLLNKALADLLGVSARQFRNHQIYSPAPYALRLARADSLPTVLLTARWSHDRRFQLARAIGDSIWSTASKLGAISSISSSRQKFQRAFAAALLCPEEGLWEYLGTKDPTDSDIAAAARYFHINEKTVRTVLVNKHLMERRRLGEPLNGSIDSASIDDVADAA